MRYHHWLTSTLLLAASIPLAAQIPDPTDQAKRDRFYIDVAGHALFPHAPTPQGDTQGPTPGFKTGGGVTTAFGYHIRAGFSTEIEWGFQRARIGNPTLATETIGFLTGSPVIWFDDSTGTGRAAFSTGTGGPPFSLDFNGEIHTASLMANLAWRHPSWRLSPYAGFGAGAFFHDASLTTSLNLDPEALVGSVLVGVPAPFITTAFTTTATARRHERRFGYHLMTGLSCRLRTDVELRIGYRYRSSRAGPINSDQVEAGIRFRF